MVTRNIPVRDWDKLRQVLESVKGRPLREREQVARREGYLTYDSARNSLKHHEEREEQKRVRTSQPGIRGSIPGPRILPIQEEQEVPDHIREQLISVEWLPTDSLVIDPSFQREEKTAWQRKTALEWEWLACRQLSVSLKMGITGSNYYSVIDGQQRLGVIKFLGFKEAPCCIYIDLTHEQEALLYEILNRSSKLGYNDLFKSRLSRGETKARAIKVAVENAGYVLDVEAKHRGRTAKDAHFYLQTMRELERIYDLFGGPTGGAMHIIATLKLIKDAWSPEYLGQQAMIVSGVGEFLATYKQANRTDLVMKLRKKGLLKAIQMAFQWSAVHGTRGSGGGGGSSRGRAFSEAMLAIYNENRREENRIRSKVL